MFDFSELNGEQLRARKLELMDELDTPEKRDEIGAEGMEARQAEIQAIDAEIKARKDKADEEKRQAEEAAKENGEKIITEDKRMNFEINSPEYREAFLKNLQGKEISAEERTALANGSYAIPQETANKIWGKLELYPLLNAIDVMHIPGTVVLPVEGTVNNAAVVAMGSAATDSADSLAKVSMVSTRSSRPSRSPRTSPRWPFPPSRTGWLTGWPTRYSGRSATWLLSAPVPANRPAWPRSPR